ncbi:sodium:calcium antiporter [Chloroflexota bacterium]
MVWLKFVLCLCIILFSGTKLARYGDIIAEKTSLGGLWIGLILLAFITSAPELVTGISSAVLVGLPDLSLGTLLGSCLFNLCIIAPLDVIHPSPILSKVSLRHVISASIGVILMVIAVGGIIFRDNFFGITLGWVGLPSIIILIVYLIAMRQMFLFERSHQKRDLKPSPQQYEGTRIKIICPKFIFAALAVIVAGMWLSFIGNEIIETTGWSTSFVGSLFLAITTSMPELVITISALRLGAVDMAIANILGANMLDIAHIFAVDLFYSPGSVLSSVSHTHLITAILVIIMYLIITIGLTLRIKQKTFIKTSWYSLALLGLYIIGAYTLFSPFIFTE